MVKIECKPPGQMLRAKWLVSGTLLAVRGKDYEAYLVQQFAEYIAANTRVTLHA